MSILSHILFKIWAYIALVPYSIHAYFTLGTTSPKPTHDFAFTFDIQSLKESFILVGKKNKNSRTRGLLVTGLLTLSTSLYIFKQLVMWGDGWRTGHIWFSHLYIFEGGRRTDLWLCHLSLTQDTAVPLLFLRADPAVNEHCLGPVFHEN